LLLRRIISHPVIRNLLASIKKQQQADKPKPWKDEDIEEADFEDLK